MDYKQIINDLQNKVFRPVYLLAGEEDYYIDLISDYIENNALSEEERAFNQTIVYGRDLDTSTLLSYAKRFPMMSDYQVVIVKEAQDYKKIDELEDYVKAPLESTLLVLCYKHKKFDKRKALAKRVSKYGVFFESNKLYDNKVPDWINNYIKSEGFTITPKACMLLTEFLGNDLKKITNEIAKLKINLEPGHHITDEVIEQNIGISKDFNVFELQRALGTRDILKANQIVMYFAGNQKDNPMIKVVAILYGYFTKLLMYHYLDDKSKSNVASRLSINPFFVSEYQKAANTFTKDKLVRIIGYLREYDMKSKGVASASVADGELMKEMIFKVLH